jgi:hypothetical protein
MELTPIPRKIYELVKRRPRTVSELIAEIWWIHPQDAPQRSAIKAHVWHANQRLKGERIVGEWGGDHTSPSEGLYRIVKL